MITNMNGKNGVDIRCSFCNKSQDEVRKLIAGPSGVYICDECVDICADIIEEEFEEEEDVFEAEEREIHLLKPRELNAFLDEYVIGQDDAKKERQRAAKRAREERAAEQARRRAAKAAASENP